MNGFLYRCQNDASYAMLYMTDLQTTPDTPSRTETAPNLGPSAILVDSVRFQRLDLDCRDSGGHRRTEGG
jgi:hypothetical protein